ncbi:MAG TPA: ATP-binding cassette domain-containing protein [Candidatus Mediterraneibacter caccogallinarum]|nr:ATP-binding cassette domain-containing protein [Candidatus Mediterraneibacter caccogallinarum]
MKLEVKDLRKSFGDKEVLHGISFSIESGRALGLLGRNGAGKTTTIRILMDVFRANSGTITVDGKPFHPRDFRIGYLPEERGLYPKKGVQEQLIYLAQLRGSSRSDAKRQSERWLKRLGVEEYAQRKLETLSKGNQQKVQLAQTLVCDPDLVILDEPFSGLDPVNSQILKDVIREQIEAGKLVIFSSHQMSYVEEFCEDIVLINHGEIVLSGNLDQIKREYGHNRLVISLGAEYQEPEQMIRDYMGDLLHVVGKRKDQVIAEMKEGCTRELLLKEFLERNLVPEEYGNYEPSLTEIFVEKAGDQA